jgi:carbon starvation protein
MQLVFLAIAFVTLISVGYRLYGRFIAKQFALDDKRLTPAHTHEDGLDFVPTKPFYLFGQHFSAISAAGPIAGPILACQAFGWLPCLVWIALGVVLIGAVHDFASLTASVRHGADSVAQIAREHLGSAAGRAFLGFIWIALIYVIVAFSDITAGTFVVGTEELQGSTGFHAGGAVAFASVTYLALAMVMGLVQRFLKPPLWLVTIIFVPATFALSWLGTRYSHLFLFDKQTWAQLIIIYCCVASVMPMWSLLQPRGYLGGFVLYTAIALGVFGIFFGGYDIVQPAFRTWDAGGVTGSMLPFLFVTIACGACSGFHGLVCSGTTSKQVDKESDMHVVGYGAMLAEAFVAFIALVTIMIASDDKLRGLAPGTIYGNSMGEFLTIIIGKEHLPFAITFGAMAFSTFVFDTLDVSTRLGRYIVQELLGARGLMGGLFATLATMAIPFALLSTSQKNIWAKFWVLFGASNQLLAALTLLTLTIWLAKAKKRLSYTLWPMIFVLSMTLWALGKIAIGNLQTANASPMELINAFAACALIVLALYIVAVGLIKLRNAVDTAQNTSLAA